MNITEKMNEIMDIQEKWDDIKCLLKMLRGVLGLDPTKGMTGDIYQAIQEMALKYEQAMKDFANLKAGKEVDGVEANEVFANEPLLVKDNKGSKN